VERAARFDSGDAREWRDAHRARQRRAGRADDAASAQQILFALEIITINKKQFTTHWVDLANKIFLFLKMGNGISKCSANTYRISSSKVKEDSILRWPLYPTAIYSNPKVVVIAN
jgi:hypothetical protein